VGRRGRARRRGDRGEELPGGDRHRGVDRGGPGGGHRGAAHLPQRQAPHGDPRRGARRHRDRRLRPPPHGGARDHRGHSPALPRAADRGRLRAALLHLAAARIPGFVPRRVRGGGPRGAGRALPPGALHGADRAQPQRAGGRLARRRQARRLHRRPRRDRAPPGARDEGERGDPGDEQRRLRRHPRQAAGRAQRL
ncbi:MAG: UDP-N-acetylmuramate:L-alanyl-gamma-D-glutamyl-meso-diaminopimelate ligase, partial [uncultured Gemmatimonadetes bacterium]